MGTFVVVLDSSYTKNTEVFNADTYNGKLNLFSLDEDISDEEKDKFSEAYQDGQWHPKRGDMFLGIYKWDKNDEDGLKKYVAARQGLLPQTLNVYSTNF